MPRAAIQDHRHPSRRMALVDGLRGLAAAAVVADHLGGVWGHLSRAPGDFYDRLANAHFQFAHGVDVFFVISGFVITYSFGSSIITPKFAARFAVRRSIRLDPPYWVAIALSVAVILFRNHFGHRPDPLPSLASITAHVLYLQGILGFSHINVVFWTLCMEVQFYLLLILILLMCHSIARGLGFDALRIGAWVIVVLFALSLAQAIFGTEPPAPTCRWFWPHWYKFMLGAVLCLSLRHMVPRQVSIWAVAALALVATLRLAFIRSATVVGDLGLLTTLATAALLLLASSGDRLFRWLSWKPLLFLGAISYSLYLYHYPLIEAGMGLQTRLFGSSAAGAMVIYCGLFSFCVLMAWIIYRAVERPSLRSASRFRAQGTAVEPPAAEELGGGIEGPLLPSDQPRIISPSAT